MTKQDSDLIAYVLCMTKPDRRNSILAYKIWVHIVVTFNIHLQMDNPQFDSPKFFKACGAISHDTAKMMRLSKEKREPEYREIYGAINRSERWKGIK